jgi:signal transduction histidine kinase
MLNNYEKLFGHLNSQEPPVNIFDQIILLIQQEKERKRTKKILFIFSIFFVISLIITPLSFNIFINQIKDSGIIYFFSTAFNDLGVFIALWQDFSLAILESLPLMGLLTFVFSLVVFLFTFRLFFRRKRLLIDYLFSHQHLHNII